MLPQKFSAATTSIFLPAPEPLVADVLPPAFPSEEDEVEQAVAVAAVRTARAVTTAARAGGRGDRKMAAAGMGGSFGWCRWPCDRSGGRGSPRR
ncbi:hypothetical protein GCM10010218_06170 [Streptomyces mashuensis]|uniref:Uncharacterized protein n=1 Tax=Streptomyces mashuensis TaxID=33904 RepID=A0A919E9P5_9ACTN|nr:hypothetical protein GCM10010218_06170 [Streptomyces mashuensis]